jgi:hypothetical protein
MAFTGTHRLRRRCIHCKAMRFKGGGPSTNPDVFDDDALFPSLKAEATYSYIPIIPRLKLLYANLEWAKQMRYPTDLLAKQWEQDEESDGTLDGIRDVWEGARMLELRRQGNKPIDVHCGLTKRVV